MPTFRGPGGLWEGHRPEELATPEAFASNPQRVWDWYVSRRAAILGARPNPAQGRADLLEALFGQLLLSGNGYLEAVGPEGAWTPEGHAGPKLK